MMYAGHTAQVYSDDMAIYVLYGYDVIDAKAVALRCDQGQVRVREATCRSSSCTVMPCPVMLCYMVAVQHVAMDHVAATQHQ